MSASQNTSATALRFLASSNSGTNSVLTSETASFSPMIQQSIIQVYYNRYEDFIVHEITEEEKVVRLTNYELPIDPEDKVSQSVRSLRHLL